MFSANDGVGGEAQGERASLTVAKFLDQADYTHKGILGALREAHKINDANERASTTAIALIDERRKLAVYIAGDSRVLVWRRGEFMLFTHRDKIIGTSTILKGIGISGEYSKYELQLEIGDIVLAFTDGMNLGSENIKRIIAEHINKENAAQEIVQSLVDASHPHEGDNKTVVSYIVP